MRQGPEIAKVLAANIKAHRKRLGLNQLDLAGRIGVSEPTVTAWESCKRWPGAENIAAMANEFGVSESDLFMDGNKTDSRLDHTLQILQLLPHASPADLETILSLLSRSQSLRGKHGHGA